MRGSYMKIIENHSIISACEGAECNFLREVRGVTE